MVSHCLMCRSKLAWTRCFEEKKTRRNMQENFHNTSPIMRLSTISGAFWRTGQFTWSSFSLSSVEGCSLLDPALVCQFDLDELFSWSHSMPLHDRLISWTCQHQECSCIMTIFGQITFLWPAMFWQPLWFIFMNTCKALVVKYWCAVLPDYRCLRRLFPAPPPMNSR